MLNEVDSGTEVDSQGEDEEEVAATENKDDEEKKEDWVVDQRDIFLLLRRAFIIQWINWLDYPYFTCCNLNLE